MSPCCSCKGPRFKFQASTWWLTTISSSRDLPFLIPLDTRHTCGPHTSMQAKHSHKINSKKKKANSIVRGTPRPASFKPLLCQTSLASWLCTREEGKAASRLTASSRWHYSLCHGLTVRRSSHLQTASTGLHLPPQHPVERPPLMQ